MDDLQAIKQLKRGDLSGLATLVERYQVQALRAAYLVTGDRALAEDVVQETFVRVTRSIQSFDESYPFAPWFLRSAVNAAVQAARLAGRSISLEGETEESHSLDDLLADPAPGPDDQVEAAELRQQVWTALQALPADQRAAVVMRYYLDLSESEMAAQLDRSPGTIKWRLHAARKHLRVLLGGITRGVSDGR